MKRYAAKPQKGLAFTSGGGVRSVRKALLSPERENTYSTKIAAAI